MECFDDTLSFSKSDLINLIESHSSFLLLNSFLKVLEN